MAHLALSHGRIDIDASANSRRPREEKPNNGGQLQYNRGDITEERCAPGHAWICHVDEELITVIRADERGESGEEEYEQQLRLAVSGQLAKGLGLIRLLQGWTAVSISAP